MSKDFASACAEAAMMPEFVNQYNRVTGNNLVINKSRSPLEAAIDKATGYTGFNEEEVKKFADFFYEFVWSKLPDECFEKEQQNDQ